MSFEFGQLIFLEGVTCEERDGGARVGDVGRSGGLFWWRRGSVGRFLGDDNGIINNRFGLPMMVGLSKLRAVYITLAKRTNLVIIIRYITTIGGV